jgi:serine/threonine protein kinase
MNAEALVGKELGSYTLRRVIGQGSMGAVYRARQTHTQHQAVVKVFLHASVLEPLQYIDFLVRFRHEMEPVALLEHPHILSISEFEERDGYVYLAMPYVNVHSLESVLNLQHLLPLSKIADYLDQLASAIDYAHEQGILHLGIKPSNILVTANDQLLLTDFALSKTMSERQAARIRQFNVGALDYMAPEQVIGKEAGEKADLYSLGAVLYHMVTGSAPFQGKSLVEVAKKHLQETPPSPSSKRADLPRAAEQVIVRALAKRPAERYTRAKDLTTLFRMALADPQTESKQTQKDMGLASDNTSSNLYAPFSLFDPQWRADFKPVANSGPILSQTTAPVPVVTPTVSTNVFAGVKNTLVRVERETETGKTPFTGPALHPNPITPVQDRPVVPEQTTIPTGALIAPYAAEQGTTGTIMKLTSPAKIVNVPVAGQPGRYLVGLLRTPDTAQPEKKVQLAPPAKKLHLHENYKIIGLAMLILFLLGTGTLWFAHQLPHSNTPTAVTSIKTPDVRATMAAKATATADANIILSDPLTQNIHNWPIISSGSMLYAFKDGAYHISDNDDTRAVPAILPDVILKGPFAYTLTMEEIKGDITSVNNEFGMIVRANLQNTNGKTITTFYTFEVLDKTGGEYQFWKYDDSQGSNVSPWTKLANHPLGNEYHLGRGPKSMNTLKIIANGKNFTLLVNGKQVWTVQDSSFAGGGIGMLVNLKGTEVAFSNLILTHY